MDRNPSSVSVAWTMFAATRDIQKLVEAREVVVEAAEECLYGKLELVQVVAAAAGTASCVLALLVKWFVRMEQPCMAAVAVRPCTFNFGSSWTVS